MRDLCFQHGALIRDELTEPSCLAASADRNLTGAPVEPQEAIIGTMKAEPAVLVFRSFRADCCICERDGTDNQSQTCHAMHCVASWSPARHPVAAEYHSRRDPRKPLRDSNPRVLCTCQPID